MLPETAPPRTGKHKIALLPFVLPYRESGTLAPSAYVALRVSAGVSRKSVHLFRWRSYFHKAFTRTKITPSRERLPNPFERQADCRTGSAAAASNRAGYPGRPTPASLYTCPPHLLSHASSADRVRRASGHTPTGHRRLGRADDYPATRALPSAAQCHNTGTQPAAATAAPTPFHSGDACRRP